MSYSQGSILVTGTNGGLGSAIVGHILKTPDLASNYTGVYTVRKAAAATHLKKVLGSAPKSHKHEIVDLDLGSLASVKKTATEINRRVAAGELQPIRALVLNAGYQDHEDLNMTGDGFEASWQINFLSNMVLSLLLLQSMDKKGGRILVVCSWSHDINDDRNQTGGNDPYKGYTTLFPSAEALAKGEWSTPQEAGGWLNGYRRYGASKLCAVMLVHELADRLGRDPELSNISVLGLDPGGMGSDLTRRGSFMLGVSIKIIPLMAPVLMKFNPNGSLRTLSKSAGDVIRACFEIDAPKGKSLYLNGSEEYQTSREATDAANRKAVWDYSVQAADIKQGDTILRNWH
ncbi:Fc.00g064320.m01.CDS01 [Cosmosporella sp. VM-42]